MQKIALMRDAYEMGTAPVKNLVGSGASVVPLIFCQGFVHSTEPGFTVGGPEDQFIVPGSTEGSTLK